MQQSADKGQTAHGSDLHLFRSCMARKCGTTKAVKDKMSAVVESSPQHSSPPETALLTFCTGTLGYFHRVLIDAAKLCWQHRCQNMEAGRWPKEALRFSFEGSRGVGRPKVGTDWCGNVKSIEQIQHLNIAKVTAQARVNQPCGVAPRRSPASLDAVRSQPEVDTQDDDDDEQKVEGGSVRSADQPLAHCAESAAAHIRPVSGRQAELAPRLLA
jgi:hypothetical protein